MNEFLAELYGTAESIGTSPEGNDVEKMAEAHVLDQVLAADNLSVEDLDAEQIVKVVCEIFGEDS